MKMMQENRVFWNITFNSYIQSLIKKLHSVQIFDSTVEVNFTHFQERELLYQFMPVLMLMNSFGKMDVRNRKLEPLTFILPLWLQHLVLTTTILIMVFTLLFILTIGSLCSVMSVLLWILKMQILMRLHGQFTYTINFYVPRSCGKKEGPTNLELLNEDIATAAEQKSALMPLEVSAKRTVSPVVAVLENSSHPVCSPIMPQFCQQPVAMSSLICHLVI